MGQIVCLFAIKQVVTLVHAQSRYRSVGYRGPQGPNSIVSRSEIRTQSSRGVSVRHWKGQCKLKRHERSFTVAVCSSQRPLGSGETTPGNPSRRHWSVGRRLLMSLDCSNSWRPLCSGVSVDRYGPLQFLFHRRCPQSDNPRPLRLQVS